MVGLLIFYLYYVSVYIFTSTGKKKKVDNLSFNKEKNHKELKPIKNVQILVFMFKNKNVYLKSLIELMENYLGITILQTVIDEGQGRNGCYQDWFVLI